jgi:hypothetical protein
MSKKAYLMFKDGKQLSRSQAVGANCYECNGFDVETAHDCLGINCALYPWSPWGRSHGLRPVKRSNRILGIKKKAT